MDTTVLHRAVRLSARASAALFASAQVTQALRLSTPRAWRLTYLAFVATQGIHFGFVARLARRTRGRNLFPGGRDMHDVGGWPTVLAIVALFVTLAAVGWVAADQTDAHPDRRPAGVAAQALIGAMFASVYLGQVSRSPGHAVPGAIITAAVLTNLASRLTDQAT